MSNHGFFSFTKSFTKKVYIFLSRSTGRQGRANSGMATECTPFIKADEEEEEARKRVMGMVWQKSTDG